MASWHRVASVSELEAEGFGHQVIADGLELAVFQWQGRVYAMENLCPHLGFPLSEGIVRDGEVICSWHGWHIRLDDGTCRRERERARTYPCEIRNEDVWIEV